MAQFEVPVVRVDGIETHPGADALEIAVVRGYRGVVKIGAHRPGQRVAYIPEDAVVPEPLLRELRLWDEAKDKGMLAGKRGNRVKAIRLRGVVSQGLLYPVEGRSEGEDLAEALGIVKYEPEVPVHMQGEVCNLRGATLRYDIESLQKFPGILQDGEEVVFTEKIHGTWTCFGYWPGLDNPELLEGGTIITSRGLSDTGLGFKWNEANASNLYVMSFKATLLENGRWDRVRAASERSGGPIFILGETFGKKVQDLDYGQQGRAFRLFDVWQPVEKVTRRSSGDASRLNRAAMRPSSLRFGRNTLGIPPSRALSGARLATLGAHATFSTGCYVGVPRRGRYLGYDELLARVRGDWGLDTTPRLYRGPFSMAAAEQYRGGKTTFGGGHVREGIVISPVRERECPELPGNRAKLKYVSPQYLLRRGKVTDFN